MLQMMPMNATSVASIVITSRITKRQRESMWVCRLILLLACAAPIVGAWGTRATTQDASGGGGRRRFLITTAVGGVVVGAAILNKKNMNGPDPFRPQPHSLDGKVMIITGGTAGLGLEAAKRLAVGGATVVLTSRTFEKGVKAVEAVKQYLEEQGLSNSNVYAVPLDLDDLESVRAFPKRLSETPAGNSKIDVLMNNAGVMAIPEREITKDGFERTFQSNHLGHFLLTQKLMNQLANDARIINVSSEAHKFAAKGLELDNLNGEKSYGPWSSYGQSKLANILFTKELQKRANKAGRKWTVVSLHPGAVQTDLARNLYGEEKWDKLKTEGPSFLDSIVLNSLSYFVIPVERGATTQVWLAAGEGGGQDIGGEYFVRCKPAGITSAATDMEMAETLWQVSEKMTGEEFKL